MVYKRLEGGGLQWPRQSDGVIGQSPAQLSALSSLAPAGENRANLTAFDRNSDFI